MNNGCVTPAASHFNQVNRSGKKHSGQSRQLILFAPPRAVHRHYSLFIIIYYFSKNQRPAAASNALVRQAVVLCIFYCLFLAVRKVL